MGLLLILIVTNYNNACIINKGCGLQVNYYEWLLFTEHV